MGSSRRDPDFMLGKVVVDGAASTAAPVTVSSITAPTTLVAGQKTVAATGTAEALGSGALTRGVVVRALSTNVTLCEVRAAAGTAGYQLSPNESVAIEVDNLSDVLIKVNTNGEGVSYVGS